MSQPDDESINLFKKTIQELRQIHEQGTKAWDRITAADGAVTYARKRKRATPVTSGEREEDGGGGGCTPLNVYKEKFTVRSYEVGISKTATVETIVNFLQEAGCNHAQGIGFSTDGFIFTRTMRILH